MEKFIKQDINGKNIPDEMAFFSPEEKIRIRSGYSFQLVSVNQRFIDKLAKLENVEQVFNFDLSVLADALTKGIVDPSGNTVTSLKLALDASNNDWYLEGNDTRYYLSGYGMTWNLKD